MEPDEDSQQGSSLVGLVRKQSSFVVAVLAGLAVFVLLTSRELSARNVLAGWNVGAFIFTCISWRRMLTSDIHRIKKRSADLDFSDVLLLFLSIAAALASIAGIAIELHGVKNASPEVALGRAGAAVLTILISWVFLHTIFTIHYAHRYYAGAGKGSGLKFPEPIGEPIYWDFLYFSFTIGVAAQTADVAISSRYMRKLVLLHAVLSFLFNTTILALAINVGASLL